MKMKFLCVFCVVLYVQSGACMYPVNTGTSALYQIQRSEQLNDQRNLPLNSAYSLHNNSPRINNQGQKLKEQTVPIRTIREPYLSQREEYGGQEISPPFIKTISEINNETPQRENNILQRQIVPSKYLPDKSFRQLDQQPLKPEVLKEPSASYETPRIPLVRKNNLSFNSDGGVRLELQGVSPETIKSLINEQIPLTRQRQDPSLITHAYRSAGVADLKEQLPQTDYKTHPTATYQNPSAESVYKLKLASPYRINTQQFLNKLQGNTYFDNVLLNTRRLQDIYKSVPPKKRYTIIHPDGRIEQIDQVDSIIARNPNYLMVKSDDIMKFGQGEPEVFTKVLAPPVQRNPTVEPTIGNSEQPSIVNQANNRENFSLPDTKNSTQIVNNKIPFKQNTVPASNQNNFETVTVNNINNKEAIDAQSIHGQSIPKLELISISEIKPKEISPSAANTTIIENDQSQDSTELNTPRIEYQNETVYNVLLNSPSTTVEPISSANNVTDITINTTSASFTNEYITLNDVQSLINVNDTNNLQTAKETNDLDTSLSSTPLPNTENTTENSAFWFQANEQFWDKLINRNNTQNLIYFLFLPPKPNAEKETKTTVYPNGTTVEEVIETINGDDGVPKVIKSTTVTYKNNTSTYSDK